MNLTVFGATGLTGNLVVELALTAGHQVTVLTRNASKFKSHHTNLKVLQGDARSYPDVEKALIGSDVVIHCLGIGGKGNGERESIVSDSVKAIISAMQKTGTTRIICMSNIGAGESGTWIYKRVVLPIFLRWLRPIIRDKNEMEAALRSSTVEWISVRLPNIVPGPTKSVRTSNDGKNLRFSITAASVAKFLIDQIDQNHWLRLTPSVSN